LVRLKKLGSSVCVMGTLVSNSGHSLNSISGDQATVDVVVTEERTLYNSQGKIDRKNSGLSTLLVRYNLENDEGTWKIANSRTLKNLVRR
jgi:hypothetical protein